MTMHNHADHPVDHVADSGKERSAVVPEVRGLR
jgi:hypothetical protein